MSSQLNMSSSLLTPLPGSPELPVLRRSPQQIRPIPLPTLPKTNAYIFTHGLYQRTLLSTNPPSVHCECMQLSCNYSVKLATTRVVSTGNLIKHYLFWHKGILMTEAKERKLQTKKPIFFKKHSVGLTVDNIRKLILQVIVCNNLPLRLVESPSFRALIKGLNLYVFNISSI